MTLGEVGGVRGDLVGDHARLHVVAIGQTEVFLRCDVTKHRGAVPADHRRTNGRRDVIVAGSDVGGEWPQCVERRLLAPLQLLLHVLANQVHRHVARAFVHDLDVVLPRNFCELALRLQFGKLRLIVGVSDRARTQAVTERKRHIVGLHDFADLAEVCVEEIFLMMREAPLRDD